MLKRILALMLTAFIMLSFSACDGLMGLLDMATPKKVLSPESAVDILMENIDVWIDESGDSRYMGGYGYCILDLDFDGILELIVSTTDGTMRFSQNRVFRINPDTCEVEEIYSVADKAEEYGGYDYYYIDEFVLYENKADGSRFYLCKDLTYVTAGDYGVYSGKVYADELGFHEENLFSEYTCEEGVQGNAEAIHDYRYYENNQWVDASYEEFTAWHERFLSEHENLNLTIKSINGVDFYVSDYSERRALLLDAYKSFSYAGFNFAEIDTYVVEVATWANEVNIDPKYYIADNYYAGMTVNDIAAIWGEDYTVGDGLLKGGSAVVYYEDERCPFYFCYSATEMPPPCTGEEEIDYLEIYPEDEDDAFYIVEGLPVECSTTQAENILVGEYFENLLVGGYSYTSTSANENSIIITWEYDKEDVPCEITVDL